VAGLLDHDGGGDGRQGDLLVYAFGLCAARAFAAYGWPADVRGSEQDRLGGRLFTNVPSEPLSTDPPTPGPVHRSSWRLPTCMNAN